MPSFDVVSKVDLQEVDNAVNQTNKEIGTRYDFKNSKSKVEREEAVLKVLADDNFKLEQVLDILKGKLVRRQVELQSLQFAKVEKAAGSMVRQEVTVRQGVDRETARSLVQAVKESKLKVQTEIQENQLRVTGKQRDDLQKAITLLKEKEVGLPLQFVNFRE